MAIDPNRVKEIFLGATEQPDEAGRSAYLDRTCGDDAGLRDRVEALLRSHEPAGSFLREPAGVVPDPHRGDTMPLEPTSGSGSTSDGGAKPRQAQDDESNDLHFLSPSTRPDSLGRLRHYEMLQILGKGGFGIVFRAFDDVLQRVVAVKVMAPQIATLSPARKRFLREAQSSAKVRHEHVVQIYEVGEQPLPYLVMEFIPGETLQQKLDRCGPLDVPETLRIGRQIAEGLAAAHLCDLIHRDIKPGNVLLEGGSHKAKITDFGLARAADDASISQSGIIAGTPMFMAPEQALGQKIDQRADLFSLGSVLYQMATGRPPFRAPNTLAVLKRVTEEPARPIQEIIPETPDWLCAIIAKLHAKNPDERFQSAREVADLLADCEAKLKAKQEVKYTLPGESSRVSGRVERPVASSGWMKWAAAAVLLLPVIALAVTEFAGVTHLFRGQQPAPNPIDPGKPPTPIPIAKQEPGPSTFKNSIGMEFVIVPKGKSLLGGGKDKPGEKEVEFPADFYLGKYEVTQEEWEKVMEENPSVFSRTGAGKDEVKDISDADLKRFPVVSVTWDQCQIFVAKLNKLEKGTGWVYRLPTEVEWEYACRGGPMSDKVDSAFDFYLAKPTNTLLPEQANFNKRLNRTCKVGSYEPNRLGLFDMHGNVWEWCEDTGKAVGGVSPRVYLGGSYTDYLEDTRTALGHTKIGESVVQLAQKTSYRFRNLGLRLARVPAGASSPEAKAPPLAVGPFIDADVKRIAALPAAEQIEEVRKELQRRNPNFDGTVTHKIEDGVVTEFKIVTDQVTDISPIRVFNSLRVLDCSGTQGPNSLRANGQLADLTPLKGMNLAHLTLLNLRLTKVGDAGMAHFKDCKRLTALYLHATQVSDTGLASFHDCKQLKLLDLAATKVTDTGLAGFKDCTNLTVLYLSNLKISDVGLTYFKDCKNLRTLFVGGPNVTDTGLAHFKDCKNLTRLSIAGSKVADFSLLKGMSLKELNCDIKSPDADIVRSIKTLERINGKPAAEFWKEFDGQAASAVHDTWLKAVALLPLDQHAAALPARLKERLPGFEDALLRTIPSLAADRQAIMVAAWLRDRNPAFQGEVTHKIEGGVLTSLEVQSPLVQDLTPLRTLTGLKTFTGRGTLGYDNQAARDGAVLRMLKTLETINGKPVATFWKDAEAKQAEFKEWLQLVPTLTAEQQVAAVVARLKERNPGIEGTARHKIESGVVTELTFIPIKGQDAVMDLSPVSALAGLTTLELWGCVGIEDLEPIKGLKLTRLVIGGLPVSNQVRDLEPLRGMKLTELHLYRCQVETLELLKDMPLTKLTLFSGRLADLGPLKDLPLTTLSLAYCSQVQDFSPLKDLPLTGLHLNYCKLRDLEPFKGMKLTGLYLAGTSVRDLDLLKGMPLRHLSIQKTGVTDLRPLQGMELDEIFLTPKNITQGLDIIRDMKSVQKIGIDYSQALGAEKFWASYDKGDFKK